MLVKRKGGYYARVEKVGDQIVRYYRSDNKLMALIEDSTQTAYDSIQDLKYDGWELVEPSLETLSVGDLISDCNGDIYRILMAQGSGEYRTYILSAAYDHSKTFIDSTAAELENDGYNPLPWEEEKEEELTMEQLCKELGRKVKIIK